MQSLLLEKHSSQVSRILLDRQPRYYTHMDAEGQVRFTENPLPGCIDKEASPISPNSGFLGFRGSRDGPANHSPSQCQRGIQTLVHPGALTGNSSNLG